MMIYAEKSEAALADHEWKMDTIRSNSPERTFLFNSAVIALLYVPPVASETISSGTMQISSVSFFQL